MMRLSGELTPEVFRTLLDEYHGFCATCLKGKVGERSRWRVTRPRPSSCRRGRRPSGGCRSTGRRSPRMAASPQNRGQRRTRFCGGRRRLGWLGNDALL
jgi:hypothetical protein